MLTGLYRFAISRGYVDRSPLPVALPNLPPQQTPYVYSTAELGRLLEATATLRIGHSPQVPAMYRTLLLLLYGSGMRIGEALRLTLQDVDIAEQVITVRDTKFFKTRLVPIGPKLTLELAAHIERRRQSPMPGGNASPLFTTRDGRNWCYPRVISWFQHVRRAAGIKCPVEAKRGLQPRLHDMRHSRRAQVVAWYRQGADVQRLLPKLVDLSWSHQPRRDPTLSPMTPDLLQAASHALRNLRRSGGPA